jgi:hypothetical protein
MKEVAYSCFNEKLDFLDNEPHRFNADQFTILFKNHNKDCQTFGWIFDIEKAFKGLQNIEQPKSQVKEALKKDEGINTALKDRLALVLKRIKSKTTRAEQMTTVK